MAFNFLRRTLVQNHGRYTVSASLNHRFQDFFNPLFLKHMSTNSNEQSFTVSYLINSCGLSPESALKTSKKLQLETPEKADLVLTLLENSGFSATQISDLIRRRPSLLLSNPEQSLLPKLEFFHSKGFLSTDIATVLIRCPKIWLSSLNNPDLKINVSPKVNYLRDIGVPDSRIVTSLHAWPSIFEMHYNRFQEIVDWVKKMGINPLMLLFVEAIVTVSMMSKCEWDKKVDVYKRLHWSEEEILAAFQKHPWCMMRSEDKIMAVMDFFVNKMGWEPSAIAKRPDLLSMSLEKKVIPRAAVVQFLSSKGLLKTSFFSITPYRICEKTFLQKFVNCYDESPQLKKLYKEKLDLSRKRN